MNPRSADRLVSSALGLLGVVIGLGGADEFRYFGPDAPQFWAGAAAAPAGMLALVAAARLWRCGSAALPWVRTAALALLAATAIGAALRVMGPPAMLLGFAGAGGIGWWTTSRA